MKNLMVNGPFSHDLMVTVLRELYPALQCGPDYMVAHPISGETDQQDGDPFFTRWTPTDPPQPDAAAIKAEFEANESNYRAIFARRYRDACLQWSDAKVVVPDDMPATVRTDAEAWKVYRQALRDVPQQAGFPLDIDWPEMPA